MSNKTHAENLHQSYQEIRSDYDEHVQRALTSNAAFIERLRREQDSRKSALNASSVHNSESTLSSGTKKL